MILIENNECFFNLRRNYMLYCFARWKCNSSFSWVNVGHLATKPPCRLSICHHTKQISGDIN